MNHATVGIDLGSSRFVIGVAKKGGVEVLANDASYRSTPTIVSYGPERLAGDKAVQKIKKNLRNSVMNIPRFVGEMSNQQFKTEQKFNFCKGKLTEEGKATFQVNYEGNNIELTSEQALAGVFKEAQTVLKMNNIDQKEMVVSVPSFLNQIERQAILDAGKVAGVDIVKLYNESAANVMNYGIFRMGDLDASTPRLVGFVDMGHSKTSVYFASILKGKADILFEASDRDLGTRNLDLAMLNFYVDKFEKQHKIDLYESPKSIFRLMEAIEKQRKILTANPEAMLTIECLFEDIDFSYLLKRDEFEALNEGVIQRLNVLLKDSMKQFGHENKIHSIERIGGGTRIPFVEKMVASVFKFETVSKTLDANESVSRGCAIQAAMLSPLFKITPFVVSEKLVNPISVEIQYEGEEAKTKDLFKPGTEYSKNLSIGILKPSNLNITLMFPSRINGDKRVLQSTQLKKLVSKEEKFEGKVYFLLDKNGMVSVDKHELRETYVTEEKVPVKPAQAKKTKEEPKKEEGKMEVETPEEPKEEFKIEKKEKTRITALPISSHSMCGISKQQLEAFKQFEAQVLQKEKLIIETQAAKYNLESFIYDIRTKVMEGQNLVLTTDQERSVIQAALSQFENWLYDEGVNTTKEEYQTQLATLKKTCDCFISRFTKREQSKLYYEEAKVAFAEFESKNGELIKHGSPVQLNELAQKLKEGNEGLLQLNDVFVQFSIDRLDKFNFEECKTHINKVYEAMNNVLSNIKKQKEEKEAEERKRVEEEKKKEAEAKKKEAEAKKKEEEAKKKEEEQKTKEPESTKMDVEN